MKILVTGATGYIGSHTCVELINSGYKVVGIDNFCNSSQKVINKIELITGKKMEFEFCDMTDYDHLNQILNRYNIYAVIHFAGLKAVGESVKKPLFYYENNLYSTINLLKAMNSKGIKKIVFSSSATVYGKATTMPIKEEFPLSFTNPYGATKVMIEQIFKDIYRSDPNWRIVLLRYFNPAGAHESALIGEEPIGKPNNLFPIILDVALRKEEKIKIYGHDYDTIDGTGVRDYIHVMDLAQGHVAALKKINETDKLLSYNLGTGKGYSVLEIIKLFEKVNNVVIPYEFVERRWGDVSICYADISKAEKELGWKATRDLESMCKTSWEFAIKGEMR